MTFILELAHLLMKNEMAIASFDKYALVPIYFMSEDAPKRPPILKPRSGHDKASIAPDLGVLNKVVQQLQKLFSKKAQQKPKQ
ncbi:MAG: hypothetical protein KME21_27560 [Desmonostoc vinosum HA7617-LM4]|jgi:hypothetical protein|nr:hypothetical protein [Desmonostoc vinosum HA7617-LM4]